MLNEVGHSPSNMKTVTLLCDTRRHPRVTENYKVDEMMTVKQLKDMLNANRLEFTNPFRFLDVTDKKFENKTIKEIEKEENIGILRINFTPKSI